MNALKILLLVYLFASVICTMIVTFKVMFGDHEYDEIDYLCCGPILWLATLIAFIVRVVLRRFGKI